MAAVASSSPRTGAHRLNITRRNSTEVLVLPLEIDTILKEVSGCSLINMQIVQSARLSPTMAFWFANTPAGWDPLAWLLELLEREKKKFSFTSESHTGLSLRVTAGGSHGHVCHHILMVLQEAGMRPMH